jgi:hypothetical protein
VHGQWAALRDKEQRVDMHHCHVDGIVPHDDLSCSRTIIHDKLSSHEPFICDVEFVLPGIVRIYGSDERSAKGP